MGRPPKPKDQRLDANVDVLMTAAEKKLLVEVAGEGNVSAWSRERLVRGARRAHRRQSGAGVQDEAPSPES